MERCVDSLLHQDIDTSKYEIILINDGSTDRSYEIAQRLASNNSNIVLLTQENQGLSGARNTGLNYAKGKYIMFVDSDDMLLPNVINNLLLVVEKNNLDVCNFCKVYVAQNGEKRYRPNLPFNPQQVYDGKYALTHGADIGAVWRNIYSRDMIEKHHLRFLDKIYHQDVDFNLRMYAYVGRMMFIETVVYCYCYNELAISRITSNEKAIKHIADDFIIARHIRDFSDQEECDFDLKNFYRRHGNSMVVSRLLNLIKSKFLIKEEKIQLLNRLEKLDLYPIKGCTRSLKTTILIPFLNIKRLLCFLF